jgi:hypothetical protein
MLNTGGLDSLLSHCRDLDKSHTGAIFSIEGMSLFLFAFTVMALDFYDNLHSIENLERDTVKLTMNTGVSKILTGPHHL